MQWQGTLMKKALLLLLFLAVFSRAIFGADSVDELRKKAEAGDANAQFNLGWMYENGDGVQKDSTEAAKWFLKSAEQGNAAAQNNIGMMYAHGDGVLKDTTEGAKWLRKSAEQGIAGAQARLGLSYATGDGVLQDIVQAHAWLNNASANGNEGARKILGLVEKEMTPKKKAEATKLAREIFERTQAKKK